MLLNIDKMKRILIALISVTFFLAACQQAQSTSHVDEDITTHEDCGEDHSALDHPAQETFEVKADSAEGPTHQGAEPGHDHGAHGHEGHSH